MKQLLAYVLKNCGSILSNKNLSKIINVSDKTVEKYLSFLESAYLIYSIHKYEWKTINAILPQKKYYPGDLIFINKVQNSVQLESSVYLHLIRRFGKDNIFFNTNRYGHEIDFLVKTDYWICIQVCYQLKDENADREFRSLTNAIKNCNEHDRFIVLIMSDERLSVETPEKIEIHTVIDFLLES